MAKITFEIRDKLDDDFRKAIAIDKGIRKGVLGEALQEAIESWIEKKNKGKK